VILTGVVIPLVGICPQFEMASIYDASSQNAGVCGHRSCADLGLELGLHANHRVLYKGGRNPYPALLIIG
jgi:hypothetical protein